MPHTIHPVQRPQAVKFADVSLLRRTLRRHAAGVTIITVPGPAGFTATSFTSVSLEPALVSFCVATIASVTQAVQQAERFAVHLLGSHDSLLADRFARSGVDRFAGTACLQEPDGLPILTVVPAWLSARVVARYAAGDHVLVIGEVDNGGVRNEAPGLVRHDGAYARAVELSPQPAQVQSRKSPEPVMADAPSDLEQRRA
ncbi:flavin reductase family protein [Actinomadura geliboluensis]|uniref:Flavin reductase family protein n=1 Tax=Actinomadura geliboluensis TaxID=882440 RepID=A0A5S4GAU7_9ACTN|nr:flavin reductase family protein [Actinomadura geliboluensis]TMR29634.1 flavin reductase family protein [Actinomadura geliboluensis]